MTSMSEQDVVMVAERAVGQQINDLRGELGVKFHEIENGDNGLKSLKSEILSAFDRCICLMLIG